MKTGMVACVTILVCSSAAPMTQSPPTDADRTIHHAERRVLTFEDRVAAQEAIDRVYYSHQIGATRPFEEVITRESLEAKVRAYLRKGVVLETYWRTPVTQQMLQRELDRMARSTKMPDRLLELYAALGNDPVLIEESLARPALVDRLVRNFFAFDQRIHAAHREEAETIARRLANGADEIRDADARRSVVTIGVAEPGAGETTESSRMPSQEDGGRPSVHVPRARFEELRASFHVSAVPIVEKRSAFVVRRLLMASPTELRIATYVVRKTTLGQWLGPAGSGPIDAAVATVARPEDPLPSVGSPPRLAFPADLPPSGLIDPQPATDPIPCTSGDTWDNGSLDDAPDPRVSFSTVWTGTLMLVWGGVTGSDYEYLATGGAYDPATDTWRRISTVAAPTPRDAHTAVWANDAMIVWGGYDANRECATGGRYDPNLDVWTPTTTAGAPSARFGHTAVWTGSRMIVWGGRSSSPGALGTGGSYDPSTDEWHPISDVGAPLPRYLHTAVWTGRQMIVWGGSTGSNYPLIGGLYDPQSDSWTYTDFLGAPEPRADHTAIWTGTEMIVWGGVGARTYFDSGGRYDPLTNTWKSISRTGTPGPKFYHSAVWTGHEMIVWGGYGENTGGRYNPATNTWLAVDRNSAPTARYRHSAVWTGSLMVVWGGFSDVYGDLATGGRYDPMLNSWTPTSTGGGPTPRSGHTATWTGTNMVVWGGYSGEGGKRADGARYDPTLDTWSAMSDTDAPSPRSLHTAVWTGNAVLVWGGTAAYDSTGGQYDPLTDTWRPTSTENAPFGRSGHTAIWTGTEMIVWGGSTNTGGRYDPVADAWQATSTIGAPTARAGHAAVWTGNEMIVWGSGQDAGRYDPSNDTWRPVSLDGSPGPRSGPTAVWTGRFMVVWGGRAGAPVNTGGRYDPVHDVWLPTSLIDAPSPRYEHASAWTGSLMLIWGGYDPYHPPLYQATGGQYDPELDVWSPTSTANAPQGRAQPSAIWTGKEMIVWGGFNADKFGSGGRYRPCTTNRPPVAEAGPDQRLECSTQRTATAILNASASTDPDSTPGTNDDIASYAWSEGGTSLATGVTASVPFSLGVHDVTLTVTDKAGATGTDDTSITVQDTMPPFGGILAPASGACFGPAALPVTVTDNFADVCDPTLQRTYDPAPGPSYSEHGDLHVTLTAADTSGNAAMAAVDFTIDTQPPVVDLLNPVDHALLVPGSLPFSVLFRDDDDDGAAGGVIHEVLKLDGCPIFDGLNYGNKDGLLSDESIALGAGDLCRAAAACGFTVLNQPELRVEATDCGGNVGVAAHHFTGSLALRPGICGN